MAAVPPYRTGTATVTAGSAVVTGTGTAWNIGVVEGGEFFRNGDGCPVLSIDSATQLTLALPATAAMAGTGAYAIALARAGAADAVTANARLAQLVSQLQGFSSFFQSLTDDADASAMLSSLGVSTFMKSLLDDADSAAARTSLNTPLRDWISAVGLVADDPTKPYMQRIAGNAIIQLQTRLEGVAGLPLRFDLPGGMRAQAGSSIVTKTSEFGSIIFPVAFSAHLTTIPINANYQLGSGSIALSAVSTSGFDFRSFGNAGTAHINWLSIGTP